MFSVGIDMIEISRIEKSMNRPGFLKFVFSEEEIFYFEKKSFPCQSIAAAFCAKEAFSKAMGTGVRGFKLKEIELLHDDLGAPYIFLKGNAKKLFSGKIANISVSLTHTKDYASAVVLCEKIN